MKKTKPLFDDRPRERELTIDGRTKADFSFLKENCSYLEVMYDLWKSCESFRNVEFDLHCNLNDYEKESNISKDERMAISKFIEWKTKEYMKSLPSLERFKYYLDTFEIPYREQVEPEVEYQDLERLEPLVF